MVLNIVFILVGIVLVLWGADRLTEGSVAVAQKLNVPELVIGLTVVAMGTSMPEFSVSLVSALKGTPDLAVGNVVGSNIFNTLLIVGTSALVSPIIISKTTVRKDVPFALVGSVVIMMMCYDSKISRLNAAILFIMFVIFMVMTVQGAMAQKKLAQAEGPTAVNDVADAGQAAVNDVAGSRQTAVISDVEGEAKKKPMSNLMAGIWIVVGLVCLIGGSNLFVEGATQVATRLGVSQAVIGLTIVAGGTSLPELATSVVSARKGNSGIAIGNVVGSNVFNILAIIGATGLIQPMAIQGITMTDFYVMVTSMILLWFFSFTKYSLQRWEGAVLVLVYVGYMINLLMHV